MLCRNCNHILTGKENFCPNCGVVPLPAPPDEESIPKKEEKILREEKVYPIRENNIDNKIREANRIFTLEDVSDDADIPSAVREKPKKGVKVMMLLFLFCFLTAAAFFFADYFNIYPAVQSFISSVGDKASSGNIQQIDLPVDTGLVTPDINYNLCDAYVSSAQGLSLRKGPADSYAPLGVLPFSTQVQIFGGSLSNEGWLYVYCPLTESYGWLDSSFLITRKLS